MEKEKTMHAIRFERKRKFLVMMPVMVFPFVTLLLWSLGVIGSPKDDAQKIAQKGFNMNLPGAMPSKDSNWNKLKFYEQQTGIPQSINRYHRMILTSSFLL